VSGSGISWAMCKSAPHSRQITMPAPQHSVFTGQMPFPLPNQQRQSTEGQGHFQNNALIKAQCRYCNINMQITMLSLVDTSTIAHIACSKQLLCCTAKWLSMPITEPILGRWGSALAARTSGWLCVWKSCSPQSSTRLIIASGKHDLQAIFIYLFTNNKLVNQLPSNKAQGYIDHITILANPNSWPVNLTFNHQQVTVMTHTQRSQVSWIKS